MNINLKNIKITALLKALNLHCHCMEKIPNLTRSAIWIFSSWLTPFEVCIWFSYIISYSGRDRNRDKDNIYILDGSSGISGWPTTDLALLNCLKLEKAWNRAGPCWWSGRAGAAGYMSSSQHQRRPRRSPIRTNSGSPVRSMGGGFESSHTYNTVAPSLIILA